MYFDALTTAAMAAELQATLAGGKVQDIVLVDMLTLGMEIYAQHERQYLLLSAQPGNARVQRLSTKPRRGPEAPLPILLLLRKYVRGGRLLGVAQRDFERILSFELVGPEGPVTLLAEIMGRRSNLILLSPEGVVMEAIKRVTPEQSRRPVQPGRPYEPPPPLQKASVASLTPARLTALLAAGEGSLSRRLVDAVAGMSPLLAREVIFRATGNAGAESADPAQLLAAGRALLVEMPQNGAWAPTVGLEEDVVTAYAPYELTHMAAHRAAPCMSVAIEEFVEAQGSSEPYAEAKDRVHKMIEAAREREARRRTAIARDIRPEEEAAHLREMGEWILAYASQIRRRQEELVVEGLEGEALHIKLDPERSPAENAQRYFREYDNARAAAREGPRRLAEVDRALARIAQWETDLKLAENRGEIDQVRAELVEAGYVRTKSRRLPKVAVAGPKRIETEEGFVVWIGRSSRQNAAVLERAAPLDLWFHVHGLPGGHIVLVTGGRPAPEALIQRVAGVAAYYSAARGEPRAEVDVTERRNVRPIPGAGPGQVTYRGERTLVVTPAPLC